MVINIRVTQTVIMRILVALCCFLFVHQLYGQQVQLHTDRTYYFPGDTVWYKVYMEHRGIPDTALRNLSVVTGRPDGKVLEQQLRPVLKGSTFGQYIIPGDYIDQELYFNLYSKRDEYTPFVAKVGVYQKNMVLSSSRPAVRVFVDGGGLLPTMPNRLSFRWNVYSEIRARLCDGEGNEIVAFKTDSLGMASVECKPDRGDLSLHWSYLDKAYIDELPDCLTGSRLRLEDVGDTAVLVVENRSSYRNLSLRFSPEAETTWHKDLHFGWENTLKFPVAELLGGEYAGDFELVYQDSVLARMRMDHYTSVKPQLDIDTLSFVPFGKNSFSILTPEGNSWNLSISVHDGLLPDIGHAPYPLAYGTAGGYRYSYPEATADTVFRDSFYKLRGRIKMPDGKWGKFWETRQKREQKLGKKDRLLRDASFGYRLLTEADFRYEEVGYDSLGNLVLRDIIFYDTLQTRIVQIDDRLNLFDYEMDWRFSGFGSKNRLVIPDFVAGTVLTHHYTGRFDPQYYTHPSGERFIKEVGISGRKVDPRIQKMQKQFSRGWFSDHESILDIEMIHENIPSHIFETRELPEYLAHKYPEIARVMGRDPKKMTVLANNVHLNEKIQGDSSNFPRDVTEIVFVRIYEKYIQSPNGRGVIMYYTSGVDARNTDIGAVKIKLDKVAGYSGFYDFHHKKYDGNNLPEYDDRQTLYWNPDVYTSGGKKVPITFYNNTLSDSYTITIQGLSGSGRTFRLSKTITKADAEQ